MRVLLRLSFLLCHCYNIVQARLRVHDDSFVPDAILRVTSENVAQSCLPSKSTVLVNGTSPGPELRLLEGKTTWIRVYNDIQGQNLTMVCTVSFQLRAI